MKMGTIETAMMVPADSRACPELAEGFLAASPLGMTTSEGNLRNELFRQQGQALDVPGQMMDGVGGGENY